MMLAGGILMVAGAGLYIFAQLVWAAWIFAAGAVAFASMQMLQQYDGQNFTVRRLRRIMLVGDVCFLLAGAFMVENAYHFVMPLFLNNFDNGYYVYLNYVHNNWVVLLLVAAILEVYSTHRISSELAKEAKKA